MLVRARARARRNTRFKKFGCIGMDRQVRAFCGHGMPSATDNALELNGR